MSGGFRLLRTSCLRVVAPGAGTRSAAFSTFTWSGPSPPFGWAVSGANHPGKIAEEAAKFARSLGVGGSTGVFPGFSGPPRTMVQQVAPDFTADAVLPDDSVQQLTLSNFQGKHVVLLFYPLDFTFVCPSELIAFSERYSEFQERHCDVLAISVDSQFSHAAWKNTPLSSGGLRGKMHLPMISDLGKQISSNYGVLSSDGTVSLRGLFLIDKEGIVRHSVVNDLPLGRSVDETLRMVDALQHFETHGEVCPANWKKGEKAMNASKKGVCDYLASKE